MIEREEFTSEERALALEREYLLAAHRIIQQHIGADAQYRRCGWCGSLVAVATQAGRALYHYRHPEFLHPECLSPVKWAESN